MSRAWRSRLQRPVDFVLLHLAHEDRFGRLVLRILVGC
jgi:hypothetical protein